MTRRPGAEHRGGLNVPPRDARRVPHPLKCDDGRNRPTAPAVPTQGEHKSSDGRAAIQASSPPWITIAEIEKRADGSGYRAGIWTRSWRTHDGIRSVGLRGGQGAGHRSVKSHAFGSRIDGRPHRRGHLRKPTPQRVLGLFIELLNPMDVIGRGVEHCADGAM